jgi:sortase A
MAAPFVITFYKQVGFRRLVMEPLKPPRLVTIERAATWATVLIWVGVLLMAGGLAWAYLEVRAQQQAVAQAESLSFVVVATATPTASPTLTASPTSTDTPTPTFTFTFTPRPSTPTLDLSDIFFLSEDIRASQRARTPMPTRTPTPTFTPTPTAVPTATPLPTPTPGLAPPASAPPDRIVIPDISLDAPVVPIGWHVEEQDGQKVSVWDSPDYAAGWHNTSAYPGNPGNVVLNGHNNIRGEVFRYLIDLEPRASIQLYVGDTVYHYIVSEKHLLKERGEPPEVRYQNAQWIAPTPDERLTLVTCWPYTSNTHRVIIMAKPYWPDRSQPE